MKRQNLYFLIMVFLFAACNKKEYPKDVIENNDATFFSKLLVNGSPINIEAGKNGYYMYSSYNQDSSGIYTFSGELKPAGVIGNSESIKIEFKDSKKSAMNGSSNINNSFVPGNYSFYDASYTSSFGVEFESNYNKNPKNYQWDFGDGSTSLEPNPIHYYTNTKTLTTCLSIEGTTSCKSSICVPISNDGNGFNGYVNSQNLSDSSFLFSAVNMGGKAPFTYYWTFGDGGSSQVANPKHAYKISGSYPVNLQLTDANLKTIYLSYNAVTLSDKSSCAANIKIKSILPTTANLGLSQVVITYTDTNGQVYSSSVKAQSIASAFNVLSVEDYENNEKGEKTKKIKLNFKCELVSGNKSIQFESQECVLCFSFK